MQSRQYLSFLVAAGFALVILGIGQTLLSLTQGLWIEALGGLASFAVGVFLLHTWRREYEDQAP